MVDALTDVICNVQSEMGFQFDLLDVYEIVRETNEKIRRLGMKEDRLPVALEIELRNFIKNVRS